MPRPKPLIPKTYLDWQQKVLARDLFTCQICGKNHHQVQLEAHHIKPYYKNPKLRLDINNGKTLCNTCHKEQHRKGWKNAQKTNN